MYLNTFAPSLNPIDLTQTEEFESLLKSAADLGIPVKLPVRYQSRNLVLNGLRFHCIEWGEPTAPPIVLLHGGNQTAHSWDLVALHLADRFHLVALDQRGHGDSEWPRDGEASRQAMADDAFQLIEALGLKRPIICGHSMGGIVTMTLLAAHPTIASKAVLVDVGPELSPEGATVIRRFVGTVHEVGSIEEFIDRVADYDPFRSREHIARTLRYNLMWRTDGKLVSKHDPRRFEIQHTEASTTERPTYEDVARIVCPTLITRGEQSRVLMPEMAERFVAALPVGKLVTVPKCGHNVHSQNTPGFLEVVVPFLERG